MPNLIVFGNPAACQIFRIYKLRRAGRVLQQQHCSSLQYPGFIEKLRLIGCSLSLH